MPITAKLDDFGKPAWILLMVLGFVWWWPLGLAILAFMIGSGRIGRWGRKGAKAWQSAAAPVSGNRAFDQYRADTLRRLEDEEREFKEFLARLREAKDRTEFDQFMAQRRGRDETQSRSFRLLDTGTPAQQQA